MAGTKVTSSAVVGPAVCGFAGAKVFGSDDDGARVVDAALGGSLAEEVGGPVFLGKEVTGALEGRLVASWHLS